MVARFLFNSTEIYTMKQLSHIVSFLLIVLLSGSLYAYDPAPGINTTAEITIYPNPVNNGNITVTSDQKIEKIEIHNILGQVAFTEEIDNITSVKLTIDLEAGIYLVKITFTDQSYNTKRIWVN
jgi:hypothetical protein